MQGFQPVHHAEGADGLPPLVSSGPERLPVTAHTLNGIMETDHVIQVHGDGTFSEPENIWAPSMRNGELDDSRWSLVGQSGQGGGQVMHNSETVGGSLADRVLDEPGTYVAVACYWDDEDDADGDGDSVIEGWASLG